MATRRKATRKKKPPSTPEERQLKRELDALFERLTSARTPWSLRRARRAFETYYVHYVLARSDDDRLRAAEALQIGFSTLKEKIRRGQ